MSTLEQLTKDLDGLSEVANKNPEEIPASVRGGWISRIEQAKRDVKDTRAEYRRVLLSNAVAIFLEGDAAKIAEFAKLSKDEGGLVVDAEALYKRLADEVERTVSEQRSWGIHQVHKLHLTLQEVMHELGLTEMPMPARDEMPLVPTHRDVLNHVRNVIRGAVGDELNSLYLAGEVAKAAFEIRYIGMTAPVLVLNAKADELNSLSKVFGKGSTTLTVNDSDEISKDHLAKTLKDVTKRIRKNK